MAQCLSWASVTKYDPHRSSLLQIASEAAVSGFSCCPLHFDLNLKYCFLFELKLLSILFDSVSHGLPYSRCGMREPETCTERRSPSTEETGCRGRVKRSMRRGKSSGKGSSLID